MSENKPSMGAIWKKTSKKGTEFLSVSVEIEGKKYALVGFANTYKQEEKQPDFKLYLSDPMTGNQSAPRSAAPSAPVTQDVADEVESQDIPF